MPSSDLKSIHQKILSSYKAKSHKSTPSLLSSAKIHLVSSSALIPTPQTDASTFSLAREILEVGALTSIHLIDESAFTRYHSQLQPFYELEDADSARQKSPNRGKITGLYLLLLLSKNEIAEFHTELERLEGEGKGTSEDGWGWGEFVKYPVMLERWLMEGSYNKVWEATRGKKVPSEEFALFSGVLIQTIRSEIASCSEKAYPSLPISNAKNLLFLDSDQAVIQFARNRDWDVRDGRIYFPAEEDAVGGGREVVTSETIIENTIGYANELETIV